MGEVPGDIGQGQGGGTRLSMERRYRDSDSPRGDRVGASINVVEKVKVYLKVCSCRQYIWTHSAWNQCQRGGKGTRESGNGKGAVSDNGSSLVVVVGSRPAGTDPSD